MNNIPQISFHKNNIDIEFEIFDIKNLFSKKMLFHSLEKPHRVNFYNILIITKGSGTHFIDFRTYIYKPGSIVFIAKGQVHSFSISPDIEGYMLLFTEDFLSSKTIVTDKVALHRLFNNLIHSPIIHKGEFGNYRILSIIRELYFEYNAPENNEKTKILKLLLKILLYKIERIRQSNIQANHHSAHVIKFGLFKNLIPLNFSQTRNAKDFANIMHISYQSLNEISKSVSGMSAKAVIDHYVILEIKRFLATTDLSIKELSYQMGFEEPTNLVKYFKKHTLITPLQFKQSLIKNYQ